jgi:hypothetical protein
MQAIPLSENQIQRAVFDNLRQHAAPGVFAFHPKNGGIHQRGRRRGINAGLGVVSGIPDVIVIRPGQVFALELKTTSKKATVSDEQIATMKKMEAVGVICHVARGLDAALHWLKEHGLLRGTVS